MSIKQCWAIAMLALVIAICFQVTNCQGGIFDSPEEEARAAAILEQAKADAIVKVDRARADIIKEQALLAAVGVIPRQQAVMPAWLIVIISLACLAVISGVIMGIIRAMLRDRNHYTPEQIAFQQRRLVTIEGKRYLVLPETTHDREGGLI
jgi:hypothetical protein